MHRKTPAKQCKYVPLMIDPCKDAKKVLAIAAIPLLLPCLFKISTAAKLVPLWEGPFAGRAWLIPLQEELA
jgi:hypothetical protein